MLLIVAPAAVADTGPTQDEVNAVARKLFCPVCENTPLDVCPTEACQQWRDVIRTQLAEGQSEQQVLDYFAEMYGDSVLAEPPPRQWVAWTLPVLIMLAAGALLVHWLRSWLRPAADPVQVAVEESASETDPYIAQLEKELAAWE